MSIAEPNTELEILARAMLPEGGNLSAEVAKAILAFKLDDRDQERVHALLEKNQNDGLTAAEKQELERYRHAGLVIDFLRSKARVALREAVKPESSA